MKVWIKITESSREIVILLVPGPPMEADFPLARSIGSTQYFNRGPKDAGLFSPPLIQFHAGSPPPSAAGSLLPRLQTSIDEQLGTLSGSQEELLPRSTSG